MSKNRSFSAQTAAFVFLSRKILYQPLKCFAALNRYSFVNALRFAFGQGGGENIEYLQRLVLAASKNRYPAVVVAQNVHFARVGLGALRNRRDCKERSGADREDNCCDFYRTFHFSPSPFLLSWVIVAPFGRDYTLFIVLILQNNVNIWI
nr:MAG TPA: hypothetical protein [Bacteriophage sp.]